MTSGSIKVTGLKEIRTAFAKTQDFFNRGDKRIMAVVGQVIINYVLKHTAQGTDADGRSFKPYTSKYAKRKGVSRSNVTLRVGGAMLNATDKQVISGTEVRVFVGNKSHPVSDISTYDLSVVHNFGMGVNPEREYMGLSKTELDKVFQVIDKLVTAKLRQLRIL